MQIAAPYLLFLGDAPDPLSAKTAAGIAAWRPERCVGQMRLPGCVADLGLPDMDLDAAIAAGARTLVVGVANRGGTIAASWEPILVLALAKGMDLASGLHQRLAHIPSLQAGAAAHRRRIFDVRHPDRDFPIATGAKRSGLRVLAVGTDCSIGKMYTALALEREMKARGMKATFRATGQTGILIAGTGVSIDAVVSDFVAGAVETLCPANAADHWDVVEGQASVLHPSYAGVTLGLVHGSQPDALVLCHEPTRPHMRGLPHRPVPDLMETLLAHEAAARVTNRRARTVGIAVNTAALDDGAAQRLLLELENRFGLPAVDPIRTGTGPLVDQLEAIEAEVLGEVPPANDR